jgi:hypothetical protein
MELIKKLECVLPRSGILILAVFFKARSMNLTIDPVASATAEFSTTENSTVADATQILYFACPGFEKPG